MPPKRHSNSTTPKGKQKSSTIPSKKKQKSSTAPIPNDVKWCLDRADRLTFKEFVEQFEFLDMNQAQVRFNNILAKYFDTKTQQNNTIKTNYKTWITSADYLRFWRQTKQYNNKIKADIVGAEMIDSALDNQLASSSRSNNPVIPDSLNDESPEEISSSSNGHPNQTKLIVDDDIVILHEVTSSNKHDESYMFKNHNISQLFESYQQIVRSIIQSTKLFP